MLANCNAGCLCTYMCSFVECEMHTKYTAYQGHETDSLLVQEHVNCQRQQRSMYLNAMMTQCATSGLV